MYSWRKMWLESNFEQWYIVNGLFTTFKVYFRMFILQNFTNLWYVLQIIILEFQMHDFFSECLLYRISSYSFRGNWNYSFLNLEIQRSQYIMPKVTVHKGEETIQGRKLYEEIRYILKKKLLVLLKAWQSKMVCKLVAICWQNGSPFLGCQIQK